MAIGLGSEQPADVKFAELWKFNPLVLHTIGLLRSYTRFTAQSSYLHRHLLYRSI